MPEGWRTGCLAALLQGCLSGARELLGQAGHGATGRPSVNKAACYTSRTQALRREGVLGLLFLRQRDQGGGGEGYFCLQKVD